MAATQPATASPNPLFKPVLIPTYVPPDLAGPDLRGVSNKQVPGRPRIPHLDSDWTLPRRDEEKKVPTFLPPQALENNTGVCYRNAAIQCLMHTPIFVNWLMTHTNCQRFHCLTCSLSTLAKWYFNSNSQQKIQNQQQQYSAIALSTPLDEFWNLCQLVFWGPRAQMKRGIGPENMNIGGDEKSFMMWLIRVMQEQCVNEPADFQLLERMFTSQVQQLATCHNLNGRNGKCRFRSPVYDRIETETLSLDESQSNITLEKAVENCLKDPLTGWSCPECGSDMHLRAEYQIVNAPEVLILRTLRDSLDTTTFWNHLKLTEDISLTSFTTSYKSSLTYRLIGLGLRPGFYFGQDPSHTVAAVHARDGQWYVVDNASVTRLGGLQTLDAAQRSPTPEDDRLMPSFFVLTRLADDAAQAPKPTTKRKCETLFEIPSPSSPSKKQKLDDVAACFPTFTRGQLHNMLTKHDGSVDKTVKEIQSGPPGDDITLDEAPFGYRRSAIKAHLQFPGMRVQDVCDALVKNPFDFDKTIRQLHARPSINLGYSEDVAGATFTTRLTVQPSDVRPPAEIRHVDGSIDYRLGGKTWKGVFKGQARLPADAPQCNTQ